MNLDTLNELENIIINGNLSTIASGKAKALFNKFKRECNENALKQETILPVKIPENVENSLLYGNRLSILNELNLKGYKSTWINIDFIHQNTVFENKNIKKENVAFYHEQQSHFKNVLEQANTLVDLDDRSFIVISVLQADLAELEIIAKKTLTNLNLVHKVSWIYGNNTNTHAKNSPKSTESILIFSNREVYPKFIRNDYLTKQDTTLGNRDRERSPKMSYPIVFMNTIKGGNGKQEERVIYPNNITKEEYDLQKSDRRSKKIKDCWTISKETYEQYDSEGRIKIDEVEKDKFKLVILNDKSEKSQYSKQDLLNLIYNKGHKYEEMTYAMGKTELNGTSKYNPFKGKLLSNRPKFDISISDPKCKPYSYYEELFKYYNVSDNLKVLNITLRTPSFEVYCLDNEIPITSISQADNPLNKQMSTIFKDSFTTHQIIERME